MFTGNAAPKEDKEPLFVLMYLSIKMFNQTAGYSGFTVLDMNLRKCISYNCYISRCKINKNYRAQFSLAE